MGFNHKLGERITEYLLGTPYDAEDVHAAKVCYAIESVVGDVQKDLLLCLLFLFTGYIREFAFCFLTVNLIRRYLGGLHMKTNIGCSITSVMIYTAAIIGGRCFRISPIASVCIVLMIAVLIIYLAPIPSPNRINYTKKQKMTMKKKGIVGLLIVCAVAILVETYRNYIVWILILQMLEVLVVMMPDIFKEYREMSVETPIQISEEAEKMFLKFAGIDEHKKLRFMTRKQRVDALNRMTQEQREQFLAMLTEEETNRFITDIHYQAVFDLWTTES